jgi:sec-independent protein translocase protein TatC
MRKTLRKIWNFITFPFRVLRWMARRLAGWARDRSQEINAFFTDEVEDAPVGEALGKVAANPMGIFEHLNALRRHLMRAGLVLLVATAFSFLFFDQIMSFLARPLPNGMESLVAIEVTEPVGTVVRVSLLSGFAISFPYIVLEIWLFIAPGLSRRSRIYGLAAIPIATMFFLLGMAFAYFVMMPAALPFLLNFMGIQTIPRPSSYVAFVTSLLFWLGIAFEFPLVIFVLAKMGLVNSKQLLGQWRVAVVIIAVVAAMVTPTVDPINMGLVMLPMIVLYFLSIFLAKIAERGRISQANA